MVASFLEFAWLAGVAGSIALLIHGAWHVWRFQSKASSADQRTIARLALHDSLPKDELAQSGLTAIATVRSSIRPTPVAKQRVLVVEDNLDSLHTMAKLIRMMGHDCEFAINGLASLKIAREFRPDVVLLDIGLPDFKGYDIARQLKWEPGLQATRIIAITGLPESGRQHALEAGCDDFYRKPIDPVLLEQLLANPGVDGMEQRKQAA